MLCGVEQYSAGNRHQEKSSNKKGAGYSEHVLHHQPDLLRFGGRTFHVGRSLL